MLTQTPYCRILGAALSLSEAEFVALLVRSGYGDHIHHTSPAVSVKLFIIVRADSDGTIFVVENVTMSNPPCKAH